MTQPKAYYKLVFGVIPLFFLLFTLHIKQQKGAAWLAYNSDPAYAYLLNSLNFVKGYEIGHTDHPGTTVQTIGGILIKSSFLFRRFSDNYSTDLETDVLKNPEHYLSVISFWFILLNSIVIFFTGFLIFRYLNSILFGIVFQATIFLSNLPFLTVINFSPEPLLLFASVLCMLLLITMKLGNNRLFYVVIIGILGGFGIVTKLLFFPVLIACFFVIQGFRNRLIYTLTVCISTILFIIPIIKQVGRIFNWVYGIFTHTGSYGTGKEQIIDINQYLASFWQIISTNKIFTLILILSISYLIAISFYKKSTKYLLSDNWLRLTLMLVIAQLIGILVIARHYSTGHYLLPIIVINNTALFAVFMHFATKLETKKYFLPATLIIFSILVFFRLKQIDIFTQHYADLKNINKQIEKNIQNKFSELTPVYMYRSSSILYALQFGNEMANHRYTTNLRRIYGEQHFYNLWNHKLSIWGDNLTNEQLQKVDLQKTVFCWHQKHRKCAII